MTFPLPYNCPYKCMASSTILIKAYVILIHVLQFIHKKLDQHITVASFICCYCLASLIFKKVVFQSDLLNTTSTRSHYFVGYAIYQKVRNLFKKLYVILKIKVHITRMVQITRNSPILRCLTIWQTCRYPKWRDCDELILRFHEKVSYVSKRASVNQRDNLICRMMPGYHILHINK